MNIALTSELLQEEDKIYKCQPREHAAYMHTGARVHTYT